LSLDLRYITIGFEIHSQTLLCEYSIFICVALEQSKVFTIILLFLLVASMVVEKLFIDFHLIPILLGGIGVFETFLFIVEIVECYFLKRRGNHNDEYFPNNHVGLSH
jgi:hypothetical protein